MLSSASLVSFAPAFAACQGELDNATKDTANPFYKTKYADLAGCLNVIRPIAAKHGIGYVQAIEYQDVDHIQVTTRLIHSSGEWIEGTIVLPLTKKDPQGVGISSTYGRRYGLCGMFGISQEDDDGNGAVVKKPAKDAVPGLPDAEGATPVAPKAKAKKAKAEPLTEEAFAALVGQFEAATTKEDITKLVGAFTSLHPDDQTKLLPTATAARKRAGL